MYLISGNDYAKQVVTAFELNVGNNDYTVQGQEAFNADDAAKLFVDNYGKRKMKVMKIPFGVLQFFGLMAPKFNYGAHIIQALK